MKLITTAAFLISAVALVVQAQDAIPDLDDSTFEPIVASENCPDVQYKCSDCPNSSVCVYPDSGGCENAGIPVCQSLDCFGILCLTRRLPCPEECPFTCRYNGPSCCPFIGEPVCEQPCMTFAPCAVTPCPEECPGDCYYPDADYCCPKSGQAVCKKKLSLPSPSSSVNDAAAAVAASLQVQDYGVVCGEYEEFGVDENHHLYEKHDSGDASKKTLARRQVPPDEEPIICVDHIIPCPADCPDSCVYPMDAPCPLTLPPICPFPFPDQDDGQQQQQEDGPFVCPLYIVPCPEECPDSCTYPMDALCPFTQQPSCPAPLPDQVDGQAPEDPIMCALYIVPCPEECPDNCVYPMDTPCPFTHQPSCPAPPEQQQPEYQDEDCDYIYNTDGYPYPYFPTDDPYHAIFTSIMDESGVTLTPSFVTEAPTAVPAYFCPLILVLCPPECRDACLRYDVPCPFATEGYCPGNKPTAPTVTADTAAALITPSATVSAEDAAIQCPHYILACPYCPEGYSCTRETTGDCPNTNVPFCISTSLSSPPSLQALDQPIAVLF